jgi:hypothetical protein
MLDGFSETMLENGYFDAGDGVWCRAVPLPQVGEVALVAMFRDGEQLFWEQEPVNAKAWEDLSADEQRDRLLIVKAVLWDMVSSVRGR